MKHFMRIVTLAGLLTTIILMTGCDFLVPLGVENKINLAVPISLELENSRKSVADEASGDRLKRFEAEWKRRMALRALTCAKDYAPAWYTLVSTVREKLTDRACFEEQDRDTALWVGYLRIGFLLAKPPLRPLPAQAPREVSADEEIKWAQFAENAGVATSLSAKQTLLLIDLNTNTVIRRNKLPDGVSIGTLSANGRLITAGSSDHSRVDIYSTETGERIGQVGKTREWMSSWLGDRGLLIVKDDSRRTYFVDVANGKETLVPLSDVTRVFPVSGQPYQYVVGHWYGAARLVLAPKDGETQVSVTEERNLEGVSRWSANTTQQTVDGAHIVSVSQGNLSILNVATLENTNVDFGPGAGFHALYPTADPDKVLIRTNVASADPSGSMRNYLFSIADKTLTPVADSPLQGLIFLPQYKQLLTPKAGRLAQFATPNAIGTPLSIQEIALERRIAQAERKMAQAEQAALRHENTFGYTTPLPSASARGDSTEPLASLVGDARIEAVGVYQGSGVANRGITNAPLPTVEVRVRRSDKALTLVLSSYEAVRWLIITEPGVRLAGVFVSGYKQSSVIGAAPTRVITMGQKFAYSMNGKEFRELDEEFQRLTGRRISLLQGRYEGSSFSVGGQN